MRPPPRRPRPWWDASLDRRQRPIESIPDVNKVKWGTVGLVLLSAALHFLVLINSRGASHDIVAFAADARSVLQHRNVYSLWPHVYPPLYPYPPVWIFVTALCRLIATWGHLTFVDVVRIPGSLGDLGIVAVLAVFGVRRYGTSLKCLVFAALYAVNPLPILISAGHGQFDSLAILFVLLAIVALDDRPLLAGLLLGIAISLKGYPVLFLPYFAWHAGRDRWLGQLVAAVAPTVLAFAGYTLWVGWSEKAISDVLAYHGVANFGWGALFGPVGGSAIVYVFEAGLVAAVLLVSLQSSRWPPVAVAASIIMAFYALGFNLGAQYLMWVLPFLIVVSWRWSIIYSVGALVAAVTFYSAYFPGALPFPRPSFLPLRFSPGYEVIVLIPTVLGILYLFGLLRGRLAGHSSAAVLR